MQQRAVAGALALLVAPGVMLLGQVVQQPTSGHDTASELASIATAPGRAELSAGIGFLALLLYLPAVLAFGATVRRSRPRTAVVGTTMSLAGLLGLAALLGSSPVTSAMVSGSADRAEMVALTDRYESSVLVTVWVALMLLGWTLGPVVLGWGLWRSGAGPGALVPLVIGVVLMVLDSGTAMQTAALAATWVGFALAARAVLQAPASGEVRPPRRHEASVGA